MRTEHLSTSGNSIQILRKYPSPRHKTFRHPIQIPPPPSIEKKTSFFFFVAGNTLWLSRRILSRRFSRNISFPLARTCRAPVGARRPQRPPARQPDSTAGTSAQPWRSPQVTRGPYVNVRLFARRYIINAIVVIRIVPFKIFATDIFNLRQQFMGLRTALNIVSVSVEVYRVI